jgi:hypothetical protein
MIKQDMETQEITIQPIPLKTLRQQFREITSQRDLMILLGLVTLIASLTFIHYQIEIPQLSDVWFDTDADRFSKGLLNSDSTVHQRSSVHPLFPILSSPLPILLSRILHMNALTTLKITSSVVASIWVVVLYLVLRLLEHPKLDATIFTLLGTSTAAAMFWLPVSETYSSGSITILVALGFAVLNERYVFPSVWHVGISAMTLSITVTNWMFGIATTILNNSYKRTAIISAMAAISVVVLTFFQSLFFKHSAILSFFKFEGEREYAGLPTLGKMVSSTVVLWIHSVVMPKIQVISLPLGKPNFIYLSIETYRLSLDSVWGTMALLSWLAILGLGLYSALVMEKHRKVRIIIGMGLIAQTVLHILYGRQTFLYSLHFIPLLVVLASLTALTTKRRLSLCLAIVLIVSAGFNNSARFQAASALIKTIPVESRQSID